MAAIVAALAALVLGTGPHGMSTEAQAPSIRGVWRLESRTIPRPPCRARASIRSRTCRRACNATCSPDC